MARLFILAGIFLLALPSLADSPQSLLANGDFEDGEYFPEDWLGPEGNAVHFIQSDPFHGRVLELNTMDSPTTLVISYQSPFIDVDDEQAFAFEADIKTLGVGLTVTIVGYGDVRGETRPIYRAISLYEPDEGAWRRIRRVFCPSCRNYKLKSLQITFSCAGEPGKIYMDNLILVTGSPKSGDLVERVDKTPSTETEPPIA